ncbi:hypothetical protein L9F63_010865, partial [Diploptera punctata]
MIPSKEGCKSKEFMSLNIKVLQIVGVWPNIYVTKKFEWLHKIYTFYGRFFMLALLMNVSAQVADFILSLNDLETLAANGSVTFIYLSAFLKQLNFFINRQRFMNLVENIQNGNFSQSLNWDEERNIIVYRGNKKSVIINWLYFGITFGTAGSFFITAFINTYPEVFGLQPTLSGNETVKMLPLKAAFPYDVQEPMYFMITFWFQFSMLTLAPLLNSGIDTFTISLIVHCCVQFQVLKHALRNIEKRVTMSITEDKTYYNEAQLEEGKSVIHLSPFLFYNENASKNAKSGNNTVFFIFQSLDNQNVDELIKFVQLLATATSQIFLFCWFGNDLTYQASTIFKTVTNS